MNRDSTQRRSVPRSLKEYGRGITGGLLFSLPVLYTMEVWWAGFLASPERLLISLFVTFALLVGYNRFAGVHHDASYGEILAEATEEMGLGLLLSALVLWLLSRITLQMSHSEIAGKIVVESMAVAIGISVGTEQLGGSGGQDKNGNPSHSGDKEGEGKQAQGSSQGPDQKEPDQRGSLLGHLVMSLCGAVLIAANVAPTQEITMIGAETAPIKLLGVAVLSLALGAIILYYSEFQGAHRFVQSFGRSLEEMALGVAVVYGVALVASAFLLWFFGQLQGLGAYAILSEVVVLAFPASLGASAGHLLIGQ